MTTQLAYTPVESIEAVSFLFFSHSWYLGEVGIMVWSRGLGGRNADTKTAHSTYRHSLTSTPYTCILTSKLSLFFHFLNMNPTIDS